MFLVRNKQEMLSQGKKVNLNKEFPPSYTTSGTEDITRSARRRNPNVLKLASLNGSFIKDYLKKVVKVLQYRLK